MQKPASTQYPIHEPIRERWSPRAFREEPVDTDTVRSLLEAARWAPSSMNEQPWCFIVAARQQREAFDAMAACLTPSNREWAQHAGVLIVAVASERLARNGNPNRHAWHDVGQAVALLSVEATVRGLAVHQMGGIDRDTARETFGIPEGFEVVSAIAVGYPGEPEQLPDALAERERASRSRKEQSEFVFAGRWGQSL